MTSVTRMNAYSADRQRRKRINENRLKYPTMPDEVLGNTDCEAIIAAYNRYSGGGSLGAFLAGWNAARSHKILARIRSSANDRAERD